MACPRWIHRDNRESLGDVEAKFFVPGIGLRREFVEYKNHFLRPSEFWEEIGNFCEKDKHAPNSYQRFVLVCPSVSTELNPVVNALRRVRDGSSVL